MDTPRFHIQMLGDFRLWSSCGTVIVTKWRRKVASLVKLLALAPDHRLHDERAIEMLWPDLPEREARNNLHQTLHLARRALVVPDRFLRFKEKVLVLGPAELLWVDVDTFVAAAAKATSSKDISDYERALSCYTGDLLPGDRDEDWVVARREELCSLYLDLLMELGQLHEEGGNHAAALEAFTLALEREPALEPAHQGLMRAYALLGRRHKALQQYERLRQALWREFEAEPEGQSQALYQRVLAQSYHTEEQRGLEPLSEEHRLAAAAFARASATPPASPVTTKLPLSPREKEAAQLIGRGLTNRRLAAELGLGVRTVDTLVRRILRKRNLKSRAEIIRWLEEDPEPR